MTQLNNLDEHFMMKALMLATAAANEDEVLLVLSKKIRLLLKL